MDGAKSRETQGVTVVTLENSVKVSVFRRVFMLEEVSISIVYCAA